MRKEANYLPGGLDPQCSKLGMTLNEFDKTQQHKRKDLPGSANKTRVPTPRKCKEKTSKKTSPLKSLSTSLSSEKDSPKRIGQTLKMAPQGIKDKRIKFRKSHKARDAKRNAHKMVIGDSLEDEEVYLAALPGSLDLDVSVTRGISPYDVIVLLVASEPSEFHEQADA